MRSSSPRYHRENIPPPNQTFDSGGVRITLEGVRTHPRPQNEYVDTPKPHLLANGKSVTVPTGGGGSGGVVPLPSNRTGRLNIHINNVISSQPSSSPPLKKEPYDEEVQINISNSIICQRCGKCRCGACTEPRELPSRWLDFRGDKVKIDPESVVNLCTCFCCVKGLFYHCINNDPDAEYESYSDPCACWSQPNCCKRWTCIALMSICLPCLCFYWPTKAGLKACTSCYNKCRRKGCQCHRRAEGSKKLLIDPDSSSS